MALIINMTNSTISECGGGISVGSGDVEINLIESNINKCEVAILQRDPAGAFAALGIPADTPHELFAEVLAALRKKEAASHEEKAQVVRSSRFGSFIQNSANAATIIQGLAALSPYMIQTFQAIF
ncbi:hypothetical protein [Pseudomonas sp. BIC9C]|uniref:hypothetical protein n=1 Tax=Pseudomonas sp. BIC9C TaxID=3078458 RepID=UPI002AD3C4C1|nr:hypothetical protein [Pseudomonas sp. BIC9C]